MYEFKKKANIRKIKYGGQTRTPEEILNSAASETENAKRYCFFSNNCEHLCHRICIGNSICVQIFHIVVSNPSFVYLLFFLGLLVDDFYPNSAYQWVSIIIPYAVYIMVSVWLKCNLRKVLSVCRSCTIAECYILVLSSSILGVFLIAEGIADAHIFPNPTKSAKHIVGFICFSVAYAIVTVIFTSMAHYFSDKYFNSTTHTV